MGDRRQIKFIFKQASKDEGNKLFLYSHWGGSTMAEDLVQALIKAKPRWDDESYFVRIILEHFMSINDDKECGIGVAPYYMDSEYPDIEIDLDTNKITIGEIVWTYKEFILQKFN